MKISTFRKTEKDQNDFGSSCRLIGAFCEWCILHQITHYSSQPMIYCTVILKDVSGGVCSPLSVLQPTQRPEISQTWAHVGVKLNLIKLLSFSRSSVGVNKKTSVKSNIKLAPAVNLLETFHWTPTMLKSAQCLSSGSWTHWVSLRLQALSLWRNVLHLKVLCHLQNINKMECDSLLVPFTCAWTKRVQRQYLKCLSSLSFIDYLGQQKTVKVWKVTRELMGIVGFIFITLLCNITSKRKEWISIFIAFKPEM